MLLVALVRFPNPLLKSGRDPELRFSPIPIETRLPNGSSVMLCVARVEVLDQASLESHLIL